MALRRADTPLAGSEKDLPSGWGEGASEGGEAEGTGQPNLSWSRRHRHPAAGAELRHHGWVHNPALVMSAGYVESPCWPKPCSCFVLLRCTERRVPPLTLRRCVRCSKTNLRARAGIAQLLTISKFGIEALRAGRFQATAFTFFPALLLDPVAGNEELRQWSSSVELCMRGRFTEKDPHYQQKAHAS